VSAKKIRIPAGVVREISGAAMAPARSIASALVGLAVVAFAAGVSSLVLFVLYSAELVGEWVAISVPVCASCGLAVVACGVALDVLRELRQK
jgi:hypothetical protein